MLAYGHTLSHVTRALVVSEELCRRGHKVIFAGDGRELQHAARKGFEVKRILEIPGDVLFGRIRKRSLKFVRTDELQGLVEADLAIVGAVKPKWVLSDGRVSARLSTQIAKVPHVAIVNVSSTHHRREPYVPILKRFPESPLGERLRALNLWLEMRLFDAAVSAFPTVARRYGMNASVTATNCLEGNELTLLPDLPEFMPSRGLPAGHHYVGPMVPYLDVPDPPWWPRVQALKKAGHRLLYLTLGSTGAAELLGNLLEARIKGAPERPSGLEMSSSDRPAYKPFSKDSYAEGSWIVVASTGGQKVPWGGSDRVFVADYLNADKVLETADLVVCHGGNGTIYQALCHGVPILGIPAIPDQEYNMRRVEALGCGRRVKPSDISVWRRFLEKLPKEAHAVGKELAYRAARERKRSASRAADLMEKVLEAGGSTGTEGCRDRRPASPPCSRGQKKCEKSP